MEEDLMMEDPLVNRLHDDDGILDLASSSSSSAGATNNMSVGGSTPLGFDIPLVTTDYCPLNGTNENCTGAVAAGGGVNNGTTENSINMFYFYEVT